MKDNFLSVLVIEANGSCSAKTMSLVKRTLYVASASLLALVSFGGLLLVGNTAAYADAVLDEARFVQRMNADRAAAGVPPLLVAPRLMEIARAWSRVLSDRSTSLTECTLSHTQNLLEVLRPASKVAENVGCGDASADALHDAFMNSPHHRSNILDSSFDSVGVGVLMSGETMFVSVEFVRTAVVTAPLVTLVPLPNLIPLPTLAPLAKLAPALPRVQIPKVSSGKPKIAKAAPKPPALKVVPKRVANLAVAVPSSLAKTGAELALRQKGHSRLFRSAKTSVKRSA